MLIINFLKHLLKRKGKTMNPSKKLETRILSYILIASVLYIGVHVAIAIMYH